MMNKSRKDKDTGRGSGHGSRQAQGSTPGGGQGRNKGGSLGPGGFCICTKCGEKTIHQQGIKCTTLKCPKCGHILIREELVRGKE